jgi:cobalt-zinc-cadmium resistance protein CzcA
VPLSALARIDSVQGENELLRENGRLMVDLAARLENRGLGGAIHDVQSVLSSIHLPLGTTYEVGELTVSTFITLLVMPALYSLLERRSS